jgi:DNA-directed RNA polymerase specialized sigma24 family protein
MGLTETGISGDREFPSTSWSAIRHAQDPGSPEYERHLRRLVEMYWRPVYCVIRHAWAKTNDDAKDLTQEFFASVVLDRELVRTYVPERGSFRALLRAAISSFMHNVVRDAGRLKRGGGMKPLPLDAAGDGLDGLPDVDKLTPEQVFDLAWNQVVMTQAIELLEKKLTAEGKPAAFSVFRRYDLDGGSAELSYATLGAELGLTAPQVKHALLHARGVFRDIVTDIVRGYVDGPEDLAAELRSLFGA